MLRLSFVFIVRQPMSDTLGCSGVLFARASCQRDEGFKNSQKGVNNWILEPMNLSMQFSDTEKQRSGCCVPKNSRLDVQARNYSIMGPT